MGDLEIKQAVLLEPEAKEARRLYGQVAFLTTNIGKAIRIYEDLVWEETDVQNVQDLVILNGLYVAMPGIERGIYFFEEKLEKMPEWEEMRFFLANLYLLGENEEKARLLLQQVRNSSDTPEGSKT